MEPSFEALAATCPLSPPVPVAWPRPEYLAEYAHTRKLMEHPMDFEVRKWMSRVDSLDSLKKYFWIIEANVNEPKII